MKSVKGVINNSRAWYSFRVLNKWEKSYHHKTCSFLAHSQRILVLPLGQSIAEFLWRKGIEEYMNITLSAILVLISTKGHREPDHNTQHSIRTRREKLKTRLLQNRTHSDTAQTFIHSHWVTLRAHDEIPEYLRQTEFWRTTSLTSQILLNVMNCNELQSIMTELTSTYCSPLWCGAWLPPPPQGLGLVFDRVKGTPLSPLVSSSSSPLPRSFPVLVWSAKKKTGHSIYTQMYRYSTEKITKKYTQLRHLSTTT